MEPTTWTNACEEKSEHMDRVHIIKINEVLGFL